MNEEQKQQLDKLARDVLILSRNTLLVNLRFLDSALSQFKFVPYDGSLATEGRYICYTLDSQYYFGDDIIFAPIVNKGQTEKEVYIPDGEWLLLKDKKIYTKGWHSIKADIHEFIAFVKKDAEVLSDLV